jgi:hypothetical protein
LCRPKAISCIGDIVEVVAHDVRLRADAQNIIADALDQRRFPARGDGAERVPGVAGDKTELGGLGSKLFLDISVSLRRRLMVLHAVRAESPFEQIDDAAMFELAGLHFKQIVGEAEEPETRIAQLAQRRRNLRMGGIVENFSVSSFLSLSLILMPRVSASIFITAEPISVNGT